MVRKVTALFDYTGAVIFISFLVWFGVFFTPNEQVYTRFEVTKGVYTFVNGSYKTPLGNNLCGKPTNSRIMFQDFNGHRASRKDNSENYGTGSSKITEWTATGTVPSSIAEGPVKVWKEIDYPCLLGVPKTVKSIEVEFFHDPSD